MSENAEKIWLVQVFDTQDKTVQAQGFRSQQGATECIKNVKDQLDEQGGYTYEKASDEAFALNAVSEDSERVLQIDCYEVWVND